MDNTIYTQEELMNVISEVGKRYGYENATADWVKFAQFKVQWQRSFKWIAFRISDYLRGAPTEVVEGLVESLFQRIAGQDGTYPEKVREYVLAPEFSANHIKAFRTRNHYKTPEGEKLNLHDALDRLVQMGLIPEDNGLNLAWERESSAKRSCLATRYSVLMRCVAVNPVLDAEDCDLAVELAILFAWHTIVRGAEGFGTTEPNYMTSVFDVVREDYPRFTDAMLKLAERGVDLE